MIKRRRINDLEDYFGATFIHKGIYHVGSDYCDHIGTLHYGKHAYANVAVRFTKYGSSFLLRPTTISPEDLENYRRLVNYYREKEKLPVIRALKRKRRMLAILSGITGILYSLSLCYHLTQVVRGDASQLNILLWNIGIVFLHYYFVFRRVRQL